MRRDVYIRNDAGALSIVALHAAKAIIDDDRENDAAFVAKHVAMLLELRGDDSTVVRIVVDEPLTPEEEAEWLARASWRLDAKRGGLAVMGGFDPDVLSEWLAETGGQQDGASVAWVDVGVGSWSVDVYAHVGSMNGRHLLERAEQRPGAAFRASHPGRPFPVWLAEMLASSGERDPGHDELWNDPRMSVREGRLAIDAASPPSVVGFVVHLRKRKRGAKTDERPPEGGFFPIDANARLPEVFPLGLPSEAEDPSLVGALDRLLGRERPPTVVAAPAVSTFVEIIETWSGEPLQRMTGAAVRLDPKEAYLLHWIAAMTSDAGLPFEMWVEARGWSAASACPDFGVRVKTPSITAFGPADNARGWELWWASRNVARAFVPDYALVQRTAERVIARVLSRRHADEDLRALRSSVGSADDRLCLAAGQRRGPRGRDRVHARRGASSGDGPQRRGAGGAAARGERVRAGRGGARRGRRRLQRRRRGRPDDDPARDACAPAALRRRVADARRRLESVAEPRPHAGSTGV